MILTLILFFLRSVGGTGMGSKGQYNKNNVEVEVEAVLSNVEEVQRILDQIPSYSVKELRELITSHKRKCKINENEKNNSNGDFLEKDEMRKKLKEILLLSLTADELMILNQKEEKEKEKNKDLWEGNGTERQGKGIE